MRPERIYSRMRGYLNAAADYKPRMDTDLDPTLILSRTIRLAIPEYTSPAQSRHLFAAIIFGKARGIRVVITRVKE